jgi:hypothetical protein
MNCRLIKHRPSRTPILYEDQVSVGGLLNLELLDQHNNNKPPRDLCDLWGVCRFNRTLAHGHLGQFLEPSLNLVSQIVGHRQFHICLGI